MYREITLDQWQKYVDQHPESCLYHDRRWIEIMMRQYGFKPVIPAIVEDERIRAAIPFLVTRTLKGKKKLVSLPFSDAVNPLSDDEATLSTLVEEIRNRYQNDYWQIEARCMLPNIDESRMHQGYVKHVHALDCDVETLFANVHSKTRNGVRKAEKEGLSVDIRTDEEAMEIFYSFHLETRKYHGLPIQPRGFFRQISNKFLQAGDGFIAMAIFQGKPISAAIFLKHKETLVYKYSASNRDALQVQPNNILMWSVIKHAAENGYKYLDYGISEISNEGLRRFKLRWGSVEHEISYTYLSGPVSHGKTGRNGVLTKVIHKSPPVVCRIIGELLYRFAG